MKLSWFLLGGGVVVVLLAGLWARRMSKRIERLSQSYWELRYEHGQLNARVGRLEPQTSAPDQDQAAEPPQRPKSNFVPLSSLRK